MSFFNFRKKEQQVSESENIVQNTVQSNETEQKPLEQYSVEDLKKELENAYMEIDYLTAKSNYFESLYNYTRMINDPNAGNANKAYIMYENVKRWEKIYQKYESM